MENPKEARYIKMIKRIVMSAAVATLLAATPAFAQTDSQAPKLQEAKTKAAQTPQCLVDGKVVADKSQKQCIALGGKWQKDAGAAAKTESMEAEPTKSERMKADPMKADPMKADPMKADPTKSERMKADPMKADPSAGHPVDPATR